MGDKNHLKPNRALFWAWFPRLQSVLKLLILLSILYHQLLIIWSILKLLILLSISCLHLLIMTHETSSFKLSFKYLQQSCYPSGLTCTGKRRLQWFKAQKNKDSREKEHSMFKTTTSQKQEWRPMAKAVIFRLIWFHRHLYAAS